MIDFEKELSDLKKEFENGNYFEHFRTQPTDVEFFEDFLECFVNIHKDDEFADEWLDFNDTISISIRIENNELSYNFIVDSNDYFSAYVELENEWNEVSQMCFAFEECLENNCKNN